MLSSSSPPASYSYSSPSRLVPSEAAFSLSYAASVAGAGRCNVVALFYLLFPQVIRVARCRHRVLGGARMVDVSATRSESEFPNYAKFVLLSLRD